MTNEELQKTILEKLNSLEEGQKESREDQKVIRDDQKQIKNDLKAVIEQTADLSEFKTETMQYFSDIKDTLRFVLHKEMIETEKEIFKLKEK